MAKESLTGVPVNDGDGSGAWGTLAALYGGLI